MTATCTVFAMTYIKFERWWQLLKAGFHMIADDRESQIAESSAIVWDRLRSCDRDRRQSQKIEPCSIFCARLRSSAIVCDRLRSFAILRSYGNQSSAICDRNVSHNNFNSDSKDSTLISNKAWMFVYVRYCSVRNTKFSQQCVETPKFLSLHEYFSNSTKGKERKGTLFKCLVVLALER